MELRKGWRIPQQFTIPARQYTYQSLCNGIQLRYIAPSTNETYILLSFRGVQYRIRQGKTGELVQLVLVQIRYQNLSRTPTNMLVVTNSMNSLTWIDNDCIEQQLYTKCKIDMTLLHFVVFLLGTFLIIETKWIPKQSRRTLNHILLSTLSVVQGFP
jgi:hypothetical protein